MAVTIRDVAREAGVSATTVSKVLNNRSSLVSDATRQRVLEVVERLQYRPNAAARALATQGSKVLGLVVPDVVNPFFSEFARACEDAARSLGYAVILCDTNDEPDSERSHVEFLAGQGVAGLIFASSSVETDPALYERLGIPVVTMDRDRVEFGSLAGTVDIDGYGGGLLVAEHLVSRGHRQILFLSGSAESHTSTERYRGFRDGLQAAGLDPEPALTHFGSFSAEFGRETTKRLLAVGPAFSAVAGMSDMLALGALSALREAGRRVPDECAVTGFDDTYLSTLVHPPLTTVGRQLGRSASEAVDIVVGVIEHGPDKRRDVALDVELIHRGTS